MIPKTYRYLSLYAVFALTIASVSWAAPNAPGDFTTGGTNTPDFPSSPSGIAIGLIDGTVPTVDNFVLADRVGSDPYYVDDTVAWTVDCSDDVACVSCQLWADGSPVGTADTVIGDGWGGTWDSPYTSGNNATVVLDVVCEDASANVDASDSQTVTIDVTGPSIIMDDISSGYISGTVSIRASGSDPGSGITEVQFLLDGSPIGSPDTTPSGEYYEYARDTVALDSDGANLTFSSYGTDLVGNIGANAPEDLVVVVDNSAPDQVTNLVATADATNGNSQINLTYDAETDAHSGIQHYNIYWCDTALCTPTFQATSLTNSYSAAGLNPGTSYVFQVSAVNGAGLEGTLSASDTEATSSGSDITSNLALWLKLDGNLTDSSGQGNNGNAVGTLSYVTGAVGQGVSLNGTNNCILVPDAPELEFGGTTGPLTLAAWVSRSTGTGDNVIRQRSSYQLSPYRAFLNTTSFTASPIPPTDSTFYHIALVWNGTQAQLYYNGSPNGSPVAFSTALATSSFSNVGIGCRPDTPDQFSEGILDEVRIYGRALSANDIAALYAYNGNGGGTPPPVEGTADSTVNLFAHPAVITTGMSADLSWESTHATSCTATTQGSWTGAKAVSGTEAVSPTATTTYQISCQGTTGVSFIDTVQVKVNTGTQYYISTSGNDANAGTFASPWRNISKANGTLTAGQTVWIRGGTYLEQITPANSGTTNAYISYLGYPGETAIVDTASGYTVNLSGNSFIIVGGLTLRNPPSGNSVVGVRAGSHNVIIRDNYIYSDVIGTNSGVVVNSSDYVRIINNHIDNPTAGSDCTEHLNCLGMFDSIRVNIANYGFYAYNNIDESKHQSINTTSNPVNHHNIYWRNYMQNTWHSNISVFPSSYEVIDENISYDAGENYLENPYTGNNPLSRYNNAGLQLGTGSIELPTQFVIMRRNIFDNNGKTNMNKRFDSSFVYNNIMRGAYQYTMYNNTGGQSIYNNVFGNNYFDQLGRTVISMSVSTNNPPTPAQYRAAINNIWDTNNIRDTLRDNGTDRTLSNIQSTYPSNWLNNVNVDPGFTNVGARDFTITATSNMLDAGRFLTTITSATGSGTSINVGKAGYFHNGYGTHKGDLIQTSAGKTARVVSISGNTITLNRSISWTQGDGVALPFYGSAPDIGAKEYQP